MKAYLYLFVLACLLPSITFSQTDNDVDVLFGQKKYEDALITARQLIIRTPSNAQPYVITGSIYVIESKFDSSIAYLQKGISLDNDSTYISGWAHARLGYAYLYMGLKEKAVAELKRSIVLGFTENTVKFARRVLDSIDNEFPEQQYDKDYLPAWVVINGAHIVYNFQDTTGITNAVYKYIAEHEEAFEKLNKIFESKLPGKITFYIWNDRAIAKKVLKKELGFTNPKQCVSHTYRGQTLGHEMVHTLSYWAWGSKPVAYDKFINEGIAVCFDLAKYDKYAKARNLIEKEGIASVMDVWQHEKKYKKILYPISGAFIQYLYNNSTPEQFRQVVKNQPIDSVKTIYGAQFDKLTEGFNHLMGIK